MAYVYTMISKYRYTTLSMLLLNKCTTEFSTGGVNLKEKKVACFAPGFHKTAVSVASRERSIEYGIFHASSRRLDSLGGTSGRVLRRRGVTLPGILK